MSCIKIKIKGIKIKYIFNFEDDDDRGIIGKFIHDVENKKSSNEKIKGFDHNNYVFSYDEINNKMKICFNDYFGMVNEIVVNMENDKYEIFDQLKKIYENDDFGWRDFE